MCASQDLGVNASTERGKEAEVCAKKPTHTRVLSAALLLLVLGPLTQFVDCACALIP